MGMTVFGGTLQRLLTCLRAAVLRFAASLAVVLQADGVLRVRATPFKVDQCFGEYCVPTLARRLLADV